MYVDITMVATVLDMCAVLKLCCVFGCRLLHSLGSFVPACVIDSISDFRTVPCLCARSCWQRTAAV